MEIGDSNTRQQGFYVVCMVAKSLNYICSQSGSDRK